jgi:hypothetical protein
MQAVGCYPIPGRIAMVYLIVINANSADLLQIVRN